MINYSVHVVNYSVLNKQLQGTYMYIIMDIVV